MAKKLVLGFFSEDMSYVCSILATVAKDEGWEPVLIYFEDSISEEDAKNRLESEKPDLVALSIRTFERNTSLRVARGAKKLGIPTIVGGIHATACPNDLKDTGLFSAVVVGDGMGIFPDLLLNFENFSNEIIYGKKEPDITKYIYRHFSESQIEHIKKTKNIELLTTFGCPWECGYCANSSDGMKGFIKLPLRLVLEELGRLCNLYDVKTVLVLDDTFGISIRRVKEFREIIEDLGLELSFRIQTRVDCFSEEHAKAYQRIGVTDILFGVETPSQKLSDFLNKEIDVEDIYKAADLCRKYKFPFKPNLILGLPTQDEEDYEEAVRFVEKTKPDNLSMYYFIPLPGSTLYGYCIENGYMPDNWSFDDFYDYQTVGDGIRETPGKLKKIDYELAKSYFQKMDNREDKVAKIQILEVAKKCEGKKWLLFGTQRYFKSCAEILSNKVWKNCLGYYDYSDESHDTRKFRVLMKKYDPNQDSLPEMIVVTVPLDVTFFAHTLPIINETFDFEGQIISASTFIEITSDSEKVGFDTKTGDFFTLADL